MLCHHDSLKDDVHKILYIHASLAFYYKPNKSLHNGNSPSIILHIMKGIFDFQQLLCQLKSILVSDVLEYRIDDI